MRRSISFLVVSLLVLAGAAGYRLTRTAGEEDATARGDAGAVVDGDHVREHMLLGTRDPTMPGPAPQAVAGRLGIDNDSCEACHAVQAAQWRGSQHQTAYREAEFQRALAHEPLPFCRGCHAPEADPAAPAPPELAGLGVGCVSCHVPEDMVLGAPGPGRAAAPHAIRRPPGFAGDQACAGCHEFAFPGRPGVMMQATIAEHAASEHAATSCADCHMPRLAGGRRDHRFAGSRDPELLRRSLRVTAGRAGGTVNMTIEPGWVGHAVPTGDLFRRLVVEAEVADGRQVLAREAQALGRRFAQEHGRRTPIADDRVGARPGPTEVVLALGAVADDRPIRWRVRHERVAFAASDGGVTKVWDSTTIAEGTLAPARRSGR